MSTNAILLIARVMIAVLFFASGMPKLLGDPGERQAIAGLGLPAAGLLERLAGLCMITGATMLALGAWTRLAAALLAAFVVVVTPLFLRFWAAEKPEDRVQMARTFVANVAVTGGLLALVAVGPGGVSLLPTT